MSRIVSGVMLVLLVTSMLTLVFNIQPARAATIIVPDQYATIQAAIDAAGVGDTVFVRSGTYYESQIVVSKTLSLVGESKLGTIVDGGSSDVVMTVSADNVNVRGFTLQNSYGYGIVLSHSSHCTITGNIMAAGNSGNGIALFDSSDYNVISENNVTRGLIGVFLRYSSQYNTISGNEITHCGSSSTLSGGIGFMDGSDYNSICHNNFIDNIWQVHSNLPTNIWDDGYPSGGNFWSNYNGVDKFSGIYQNVQGSDGIGDTPFNILPGFTGSQVTDNFPLMVPQCACNSLVGYWKFDEGSGNVAYDSSENQNTGTFQGSPIWVDGIIGKALSYSNGYVSVPSSPSLVNLGDQVTVEFWFKSPSDINSANSPSGNIIDKTHEYGFQLDVPGEGESPGPIWFFVVLGPTYNWHGIASVTENWKANTWYQLVGAYDGGYLKIYVNGKLENTQALTGNLLPSYDYPRPLIIGPNVPWTMDEVKIYNYARTAQDILNDYSSVPQGPVGYWDFNEGSGTVASDRSGNGNTGTLINGPQWVQGTEGTALSFDGVASYVSVPASPSLNVAGNQVSAELWFKPTVTLDSSTHATCIIDKGNAYSFCLNMPPYQPVPNGKVFYIIVVGSQQYEFVETTTNVWTAGTWYHIAGTYDGNYIRIYVNGALENSKPVTGTLWQDPTPRPFAISAYCYGPARDWFFNGAIDEAKIYNYARTAQEIQSDYSIIGNSNVHFESIRFNRNPGETTSKGAEIAQGPVIEYYAQMPSLGVWAEVIVANPTFNDFDGFLPTYLVDANGVQHFVSSPSIHVPAFSDSRFYLPIFATFSNRVGVMTVQLEIKEWPSGLITDEKEMKLEIKSTGISGPKLPAFGNLIELKELLQTDTDYYQYQAGAADLETFAEAASSLAYTLYGFWNGMEQEPVPDFLPPMPISDLATVSSILSQTNTIGMQVDLEARDLGTCTYKITASYSNQPAIYAQGGEQYEFFMWYDRAVTVLKIPSGFTLVNDGSADLQIHDGGTTYLLFVDNYADKMLSYGNTESHQIEVACPQETSQQVEADTYFMLGPYYPSAKASDFPINDYDMWNSSPESVYWVLCASNQATASVSLPWWASVFSGSIGQQQTQTMSYTSQGNEQLVKFELSWPGSQMDLHIYDQLQRHVGVNYTSGQVENQIPGSEYYDFQNHTEVILIHCPQSGNYLIDVFGKDVSDGEGFTLSIKSTSDNVPPTTTLSFGPPNYLNPAHIEYVTNQTSFSLIAKDDLGSGVADTSYKVTNSTYDTGWMLYSVPFKLTSLGEGSYSLSYNSTDNAGNIEQSNTVSIAIDNTPPITSLAIGDPKYSIISSTFVTSNTPFTLFATDGSGSGIASSFYKIWNSTYNSGWLTYSNPFCLTGIADGNYTVTYYSVDNLGNRENEHAVQVALFSWTYLFTDSCTSTTLKVNGQYKLFQFNAPDKDFGVGQDSKMMIMTNAVAICHNDSKMCLTALAEGDGTYFFCWATARDKQTGKTYWLTEYPPSYELTVYCNDTNGKPVSGARVYVDGCYLGRTDLNGRLVIADVFAGKHDVTVERCGYSDSSSTITVTSDATLNLTMTPLTYTLTVCCKDSKCRAISGASVYLNNVYQGKTDPNGKLAISNLAAGTYTVTIKKSGYRDTCTSVTITGDKTITITMM